MQADLMPPGHDSKTRPRSRRPLALLGRRGTNPALAALLAVPAAYLIATGETTAVVLGILQLLVIVRLMVAARLVLERRDREIRHAWTQARIDALTGLPNRRALLETLERETARARRRESPLSVAILDLDQFKRYNDQHGHAAGDRMLTATADAWSYRTRAMDLLARHGGEEFAVVFPDTALEDARIATERIREATPDPLTASAGLATWDGIEPLDALVERADRALYIAKRAGRDRCVTESDTRTPRGGSLGVAAVA